MHILEVRVLLYFDSRLRPKSRSNFWPFHSINTSETRRHTIDMNASTIAAFGMIITLTFDLWAWKPSSAKLSHMMNICGKCHWNSSTKWKDVASREIAVNERRTDGQQRYGPPVNTMSWPRIFRWRRHKIRDRWANLRNVWVNISSSSRRPNLWHAFAGRASLRGLGDGWSKD